jgi:apolipoprotein D and lipocalin family protein
MEKIVASILIFFIMVAGCIKIPAGLEPVQNFDLNRYLGKWYEIARLDHSFERNTVNVTTDYEKRDKTLDNKILSDLVTKANSLGFETNKLNYVDQH